MSTSELITLRGGLVVSVGALQVLWALEEKGLHVRQDTNGSLVIGPRSKLTADDDTAIRTHKDDIKALVQHVELM